MKEACPLLVPRGSRSVQCRLSVHGRVFSSGQDSVRAHAVCFSFKLHWLSGVWLVFVHRRRSLTIFFNCTL